MVKFSIYDVAEEDVEGTYNIRLWAHSTEKRADGSSQVICIRIEDYHPFVEVIMPGTILGKTIPWNNPKTKEQQEMFVTLIKNYHQTVSKKIEYGDPDHVPVAGENEIIVRSRLEGFVLDPKDDNTIVLRSRFHSKDGARHYKNVVRKPCQVKYMGNTIPMKATISAEAVTHHFQMMCEQKIHNGSWCIVDDKDIEEVPFDERITIDSVQEYRCSYKVLYPLPEDECSGDDFKVYPKIMSTDLECNSENILRFPSAMNRKDEIFMISAISQVLYHNDTRVNKIISTVDSKPNEEYQVVKCDDEKELLEKWMDEIIDCDPTIITGYNIFRFDYPYINDRWKTCHIADKLATFKNVSRLKGEENRSRFKITEWKSGAYGFVTISTIHAEGRLDMDMYPLIKRDHKFDRYTLDFVANHFLGKGKHDVTAKQMFIAFQKQRDLKKELDEWASHNLALFKDRTEYNSPYKNCSLCCSYDGTRDNQQIFKEGKHHGCRVAVIQERLSRNYEEMDRISAYCVEDSGLCIDLCQKLNSWISVCEFSAVVEVPVIMTYTRGQQIRVYNQLYRYTQEHGYILLKPEHPRGKVVGGLVQEPKVGMHVNCPILDFASLYPSNIITDNLCYTTYVTDHNIPDDMCNIRECVQPEGTYVYRFIKKEIREGILPRMLRILLATRASIRKIQKVTTDRMAWQILEQKQLAVKVSANSVYGFLDANMLPFTPVARATTAAGRERITVAKLFAEAHPYNADTIYGDTDSVMVYFGSRDHYHCKKTGEQIEQDYIDKVFNQPDTKILFELEAIYVLFFSVMKKKYAAVVMKTIEIDRSKGDYYHKVEPEQRYQSPSFDLYEVHHGDNVSYVLVTVETDMSVEHDEILGVPAVKSGFIDISAVKIKGLSPTRRENCQWLRKKYVYILGHILLGLRLETIVGLINDEIIKMATRYYTQGKYFDQLLMTREIGSEYKPNATTPMKLFVEEMKQIGRPVERGERIDFVIVRRKEPQKNAKQGTKMYPPDLFWERADEEPVDVFHYIFNNLAKNIDQLLYVGFKEQIDKIMAEHPHYATFVHLMKVLPPAWTLNQCSTEQQREVYNDMVIKPIGQAVRRCIPEAYYTTQTEDHQHAFDELVAMLASGKTINESQPWLTLLMIDTRYYGILQEIVNYINGQWYDIYHNNHGRRFVKILQTRYRKLLRERLKEEPGYQQVFDEIAETQSRQNIRHGPTSHITDNFIGKGWFSQMRYKQYNVVDEINYRAHPMYHINKKGIPQRFSYFNAKSKAAANYGQRILEPVLPVEHNIEVEPGQVIPF